MKVVVVVVVLYIVYYVKGIRKTPKINITINKDSTSSARENDISNNICSTSLKKLKTNTIIKKNNILATRENERL